MNSPVCKASSHCKQIKVVRYIMSFCDVFTQVMISWCLCPVLLKQSAERCVSTLLDLIQTKVNYVVQEAIVVIRDIFRKYPNKYVSC